MGKRKTVTQKTAVLAHLKSHRGITTKEAFTKYGITRLSAVIWRLRKDGYTIENEKEQCMTRLGNIARYDRYCLVESEET